MCDASSPTFESLATRRCSTARRIGRYGTVGLAIASFVVGLIVTSAVAAQDEPDDLLSGTGVVAPLAPLAPVSGDPSTLLSPESLPTTIPTVLVLSALSLAPAVLLMTTSFVRIVVVLGLLRQAIGLNQLPPTQVITALALFLTVLIMSPVWTDVYQDAVAPYCDKTQPISLTEAWNNGVGPLRRFMSRQIEAAGNTDDVWLFYSHLPSSRGQAAPKTYDDVPLQALLPAFLLSELKVAFLIGFQIYLPFLIVDLVVASMTTSMGMVMVPPGMVSLPLKILLFVLLDGWHLVVGLLLESFAPYS